MSGLRSTDSAHPSASSSSSPSSSSSFPSSSSSSSADKEGGARQGERQSQTGEGESGAQNRLVPHKDSHKRKDSGFAQRENVKKAAHEDYWSTGSQVVMVSSSSFSGEDEREEAIGDGGIGWAPPARTLLDLLKRQIGIAATEALDEYDSTILSSWQQAERRFMCEPADFMQTVQTHVTPSMRSVLIDWMVEVCEEYKLQTQTLFLSVHYLDRMLCQQAIVRQELQLVGIVAMFVACKYEEKEPPSLGEFVYVSDHTYSKRSILEMERVVLNALHFRLSSPTPFMITARLSRKMQLTEEVESLAHYIGELFLQEPGYVTYLPSAISLSAMFLAQHVINHCRALVSAPASPANNNNQQPRVTGGRRTVRNSPRTPSADSSASTGMRGSLRTPLHSSSSNSSATTPSRRAPFREPWNEDMASLATGFQHGHATIQACATELHACFSLTTNCSQRRDPLMSVQLKYESADKFFVQRYSKKETGQMSTLPWPPAWFEQSGGGGTATPTNTRQSSAMDLTSPLCTTSAMSMELSTPLKMELAPGL
jgi:hypothetical protein